ncbi:hypothetical protein NESM_000512300 [Novymonas esmeraldas]|uniref:Uncharacterized protein n=1 Tax=Novymonas esmeraldas TaxID=1808958 RepID=A0AAW0EP32_9TRYP
MAPRSRWAAVALLVTAAALLSCVLSPCPATMAAANSDDLPKAGWGRPCLSPYDVCATVEVYQYWEEKKNRLSFSVDAFMSDPNAKGTLTVWIVADDPDISVAKEFHRVGMNAVVVHPRGSKATPSYLTCVNTSSPTDAQCWMTAACATELATASGTAGGIGNASHYTVDQTAHDLDWALRTLGDGRPNVVMAEGLSTVVALRLLQLHPDTSAAFVLVDFVNPLLFNPSAYFTNGGMDSAMQHLLALCDDRAACVGRLGASDGSWNRLRLLMDRAKAGTLPCAARLKWVEQKGNSVAFTGALRDVLARMLRYPVYPFATSKAELRNLVPSLLYRLQRCNDKDVVALNKLFDYLGSSKSYTCPDNGALQMHWLVNAFQLPATLPDLREHRSAAEAKYTVLPPADAFTAFHEAAAKFPRAPPRPATTVLPVNATQKILLLTADMDALLPGGAASQVALAFSKLGGSVQLRQLRGTGGQPSMLLLPCLVNNMIMLRDKGMWADEVQCTLDQTRTMDFVNSATDAYYGTADAWDFDVPNTDDRDAKGGGDGGQHSWSLWRTFAKLLLALLVLGGVGAGAYFGVRYMRARGAFPYNRVSDDFYENLHR